MQTDALSRRRTRRIGPHSSNGAQSCAHQGRTETGHMLLPARRGPAWLAAARRDSRLGSTRLDSTRLTKILPDSRFSDGGGQLDSAPTHLVPRSGYSFSSPSFPSLSVSAACPLEQIGGTRLVKIGRGPTRCRRPDESPDRRGPKTDAK